MRPPARGRARARPMPATRQTGHDGEATPPARLPSPAARAAATARPASLARGADRVAHERVGQDHFGVATLDFVAGRQQRGVESEAQHAPCPNGVLQARTLFGIELEPTPRDGDDGPIGRRPADVAPEYWRAVVERRGEQGPVTQADEERMGAEPARPKPEGEGWRKGAATGGSRSRPRPGREPDAVVGCQYPAARPGARRAGVDRRRPHPESRVRRSARTRHRPGAGNGGCSGSAGRRATRGPRPARARDRQGPRPRRPAPVVARSRRLSPAGPTYDSVRNCWRISTFSRRVPGVCSRNVQRTTPFPSISTYARFEKNLSSSSVP